MNSQLIQKIEKHSQLSSVAIIIDTEVYTYKQLYNDSISPIQFDTLIQNSGRCIAWIESESMYVQIVRWLQALYNGYIPILVHRHMHSTYRNDLYEYLHHCSIPKEAKFGVLTSGTTGMPKPLWRTEESWVGFFDTQNNVFSITSETKIFTHGSFSFTGNTNMMLGVLWAGGTIISSDKMQPKRWLTYIEQHNCSHIYMLPTKLRLLIRHRKEAIQSVNRIIAGSQVVDEGLLNDLEILFPSMEFILYYGASELNYISYCTGAEWRLHPNTVGRPFPSVHVDIVDSYIYITTDYGVCGVTGPTTVHDRGYWEVDSIMFEGRREECINRGGYKVAILPLEVKLQNLSSIDEVAVIGIDDSLRGEEVVAFVVSKVDKTYSDIEREIREFIPIVEQPKHIRLIDALPLTDCSKVDKVMLKSWYNKS